MIELIIRRFSSEPPGCFLTKKIWQRDILTQKLIIFLIFVLFFPFTTRTDFTKEELPASCTFPNWITNNLVFRTIAGNERYDFSNLKQLAIEDLNGQTDFRATCIRSEETAHRHRKFIALFYVKRGW